MIFVSVLSSPACKWCLSYPARLWMTFCPILLTVDDIFSYPAHLWMIFVLSSCLTVKRRMTRRVLTAATLNHRKNKLFPFDCVSIWASAGEHKAVFYLHLKMKCANKQELRDLSIEVYIKASLGSCRGRKFLCCGFGIIYASILKK